MRHVVIADRHEPVMSFIETAGSDVTSSTAWPPGGRLSTHAEEQQKVCIALLCTEYIIPPVTVFEWRL